MEDSNAPPCHMSIIKQLLTKSTADMFLALDETFLFTIMMFYFLAGQFKAIIQQIRKYYAILAYSWYNNQQDPLRGSSLVCHFGMNSILKQLVVLNSHFAMKAKSLCVTVFFLLQVYCLKVGIKNHYYFFFCCPSITNEHS